MKITILGDIMCEPTVLNGGRQPDGSYNFDSMYTRIKPLLQQADYVIGNLETPLAGEAAGYTKTFFSFNAPDSFAAAMQKAGIDLVSTINNHTYDRGPEGIVRTMEVLDRIGLPYVGTALPGTHRPEAHYFEADGVKVAVIAYTYGINGRLDSDEHPMAVNANRLARFGNIVCGEKHFPTDWVDKLFPGMELAKKTKIRKRFKMPYLAMQVDNLINHELVDPCLDRMVQDIKTAREKADLVLVYPHIGGQFNVKVGDFTRNAVEKSLEAGADAVIASHSHVVQKAEYLGNAPVAYCLGNFSMSPLFYAVESKYLREYGLAAHLYLDGNRVEKFTFTMLKAVPDEHGQLVSWPLDQLEQHLTSKKELEKLREEAAFIYRCVTEQDLPAGPLQTEYEIAR